MKRFSILFVILLCAFQLLHAQIPTPQSGILFGGGGQNGTRTIQSYPDGSSIVTGEYSTAMTLGTLALSHSGNADAFVAKLNPAGQFLWAKSLNGAENDWLTQAAIDGDGNVVIVGEYAGPSNFGGIALPFTDGKEGLLVKLSPGGDILWHKEFQNTGDASIQEVALDASGQVYAFGQFNQTLSLGNQTLSTGTTTDVFLVKYAADGALQWAKRYGGAANDTPLAIWVSNTGEAYCAGTFLFLTTLGDSSFTSKGSTDFFLFKVSPSGDWVWSRAGGGIGNDHIFGMTGDNQGGLYVSGVFMNTMVLGNETLTSNGQWDVFFSRCLEDNGLVTWTRSFGGSDNDRANDIRVGRNGKVYGYGWFQQTMQVGPSSFTSQGWYDTFLIEMDANGLSPSCLAFGGAHIDVGSAMSTDTAGNLYLTGYTFSPTMQIGPLNLVRPNSTASFWFKLGNTPTQNQPVLLSQKSKIWRDEAGQWHVSSHDPGFLEVVSVLGRTIWSGNVKGETTLPGSIPSGLHRYRIRHENGLETGTLLQP